MTTTIEKPTAVTPDQTTATGIGLLVVRVGFGGLMAAFGAQKLFGWFNGYGLDGTAQGFDAMGYNPGKLFATLAGLSELVGGLLLVFGAVTPLAAAIVLGTMINAINALWSTDLFPADGGTTWATPLTYAIVAAALAFTGAGKFSVDELVIPKRLRVWEGRNVLFGAVAVAVALGAALLTLVLKWAF